MDILIMTGLYVGFLVVDYRRVIKKRDKTAIILSGVIYFITYVIVILVLAGVKVPSPWQWLLDFFYNTIGIEKPKFGV